jgi:glutamyl-tRNA synthetase
MAERRTRLAPSPTGALHLGNARTFLINWALARQRGWRVWLRVEDLDGPRIKPGAVDQAIDVLRWLGLDWDEGPVYQRHDLTPYHAALQRLGDRGLIYPCRCTRREIERAQSAPHEDEHELRYPATCRPPKPGPVTYEPTDDASMAWRLITPDEPITFHDELLGTRTINPQEQVGDFLVATKAGLPAYQLAVVVDDARQGVTDVVRGDDLVRSTPRQLLLYRLLGLAPTPDYIHVPLVLGEDGRRLAKRHGDTRLIRYRDEGVPTERVIGLLGAWCGLGGRQPMSAAEFAERFDLRRLPREPVTFTDADHDWLLAATEARA